MTLIFQFIGMVIVGFCALVGAVLIAIVFQRGLRDK